MPSVACLARFTLNAEQVEQAAQLLNQETQWRTWLEQIEVHGLSGFANQHIEQHGLPVPTDTVLSVKALNMRHKAIAQARYQAVSDLLAGYKNKVPLLALKGVALMPYVYEKPELRPMRDMDFLVPLTHLEQSVELIKECGFDMPAGYASCFTQGTHELPTATKKVNGFTCSVEIHKESIPRDVSGTLSYPTDAAAMQTVRWHDLELTCFEDVTMLHQVARHLEGLHPGNVMKLINMMDVVALAQVVNNNGRWPELALRYPHVLSTLECLHLITPLPEALQAKLNVKPLKKNMQGVGQIMKSFRTIVGADLSMLQRIKALLTPSDWWLHLHYNVSPHRSIWVVKFLRHPFRIMTWAAQRVYFGLAGSK